MNWQTNDSLRRHFMWNCTPIIWITMSNVQQYRWRCTSPLRLLEEIKHWSLARERTLLPLHNLLIASNHPHCSWSTCRWTDIQVQDLRHGATELICKFRSSDTVPLNWYANSGVQTRFHWTDMQVQEFRHGANELTVQVSSVTRCHWTDIHVQHRDTVPMKWSPRSALWHCATWHPISAVKCGANEMVFKLNPETQLKLEFWVGCLLCNSLCVI